MAAFSKQYTRAATLSLAAAASPYFRGRKDYREPLITVVKMQGILQSFSGPARAPQGRRLLNVDRVQRWLERAFHKPLAPAAMALVVNSPGGSPAQAEMIYNLVKRLSKESGIKVLTFAEEVAASGGWGRACWAALSGHNAMPCHAHGAGWCPVQVGTG